MNENAIRLGGKETEISFDMWAWLEVEKKFGTLAKMEERMSKNDQPMAVGMELVAIEINASRRKNGEKPDLSAEWVADQLTPKKATEAVRKAKMAMYKSLTSEEADDADEEIDAVAEEIQKKTENH